MQGYGAIRISVSLPVLDAAAGLTDHPKQAEICGNIGSETAVRGSAHLRQEGDIDNVTVGIIRIDQDLQRLSRDELRGVKPDIGAVEEV